MSDQFLSQAAMRARAKARFDCFIECVEDGRETSDALGLLRVRVKSAKAMAVAGASTATWFPLPSVRRGRVVVAGKRSMHMQFTTSTGRGAAGVDNYATASREGPAADARAGQAAEGGELASEAKAVDAYATRDRSAPGDRPDEQVITNMASTSAERAPVWHQIERHEYAQHKTGLDRINVQRDTYPEFWAQVENHPECPRDFRDFLHCRGRHWDAGKKLDKRRAKVGTPYITANARRYHTWLKTEFDRFAPGQSLDAPFSFSPARQAVSERHGDIELPSELDNAAHQRIAEKLRDKIETYSTTAERRVRLDDGAEVEGRLPVVIAYHPPEAGNNERNWHLHFLFHDRAIYVDADSKVHFAPKKARALTGTGMMKRFRKDVEAIINDELAAAGETVRVTTASLADLGSDTTPQLKLGKGLSRIEAAGDLTDKGLHNRVESWRRLHRENTRYVADRQRNIDADDAVLQRKVSTVDTATADECHRLDQARIEVARLQKAALQAEADRRYAAYVIEMAESSVMDALEKASRQRDLASTQKQRAKWAAETDALSVRHRELREELRAEYATRDHADAVYAEAAAQARTARASVVDAVDRLVERKLRLQLARLATALTRVVDEAPRLAELHRLVTRIDTEPFAVTKTNGIWGIAAADDPNGVFAGVDLSMSEIQHRLGLIAGKHENEQRIAAAWLKKRGSATSREDVLAGATEYVRKQLVRWGPHLAEHELTASRQAAGANASARLVSVGNATSERERPLDGINLLKASIKRLRGPNPPVSPTPADRRGFDAVEASGAVKGAIRTMRVALGADERHIVALEPEVPQNASSTATREASPAHRAPAPAPRVPTKAQVDPTSRSALDQDDETLAVGREEAVATRTTASRPALWPGNFSLGR